MSPHHAQTASSQPYAGKLPESPTDVRKCRRQEAMLVTIKQMCCRGGKLLLMPIDEASQMRPHMSHLDATAAKPSQEVVKQEDPVEELVALQVFTPPPPRPLTRVVHTCEF